MSGAGGKPSEAAPAEGGMGAGEASPDAGRSVPAAGSPSRALIAFTLLAVLLGTLGSLSRAGVWDPPELETAELSRRLAHGLLGAAELGAEGDGDVPTRGELGRGELPFLSIALGFRLFGLSVWAGRLPLALWALLGVAALYVLVRRLVSARAACLSALALASMPLYFLNARTMLGDIVSMAALSGAVSGLCLALLDPGKLGFRLAALLAGGLFLGAGFLTRGLVIGVAVPALGVGLAALALRLSGNRLDRLGAGVGLGCLALGALAVVSGALAVRGTPPELYSMRVGAFTGVPAVAPTFDFVVRDLGHALFPWSALIPFAVARALAPRSAPSAESAAALDPGSALRLVLVTTAGVALLAHGALAPETGSIPFAAPAALAALAALALNDFDAGAPPSRALGLGVGALALVLLLDFRNSPEKALTAFGVEGVPFPASFAGGFGVLAVSALGSAVLFFLLIAERETAEAGAFRGASYLVWPKILRAQWAGNLLFGVLITGAALLGLELLRTLSDHALHLRAFETMGELARLGVRAGWVLIALGCAAPLLLLAARDAVRVALAPAERFPRLSPLRRVRIARGTAAAVVFAAAGASLGILYYPPLLDQLSPKEVFDSFRRAAREGEPLGLLGTDAASARYHASGNVRELGSIDAALSFLLSGEERRFLVFRSSDLAGLNAGFRSRRAPARNLPILDGRSSEILLASNRLLPGERDQNPLRDIVLASEPRPAQKLDVDLAGKLLVLGWEVRNAKGEVVRAIVPGAEYEFSIYYRVTDRITGNWETFIHVDGFQRRFNGDHPTLAGKYPLAYWRRGDSIVDRHTFRLEPNFAPGAYQVYFGLYSGSRRLEVRRGRHEENRIVAGELEVR